MNAPDVRRWTIYACSRHPDAVRSRHQAPPGERPWCPEATIKDAHKMDLVEVMPVQPVERPRDAEAVERVRYLADLLRPFICFDGTGRACLTKAGEDAARPRGRALGNEAVTETVNEDGTPVLIEALYAQHYHLDLHECDTIEGALSFLESGEDWGNLSSIGVFVDGECVRADPYVEPDQRPTADEATKATDLYRRAKAAEGTGRLASV